MRSAGASALLILVVAAGADAGTVALELRFNGVAGLHELQLTGSQTATIELWASVSPGDSVASANIAWDIYESAPYGFMILDREIAAGWYDLSGDPFSASAQPSGYFHGYFTGEGAGDSTGTFLLERYLIHSTPVGSVAVISVVAANPLNPGQLTEVNSSLETLALQGLPPSITLYTGVPEPAGVGLVAWGSFVMLRRRRA